MVNTEKMNKLMREVEDLMRDRANAKSKRDAIVKEAGEAVISGVAFDLECKTTELSDIDFTIRWTEERLAEVKTEMTNMIAAIRFWDA